MWPKLPLITIEEAQKCPCLRRGCRCNYNQKHPYRRTLLTPPENKEVVKTLKNTIAKMEKNRREGNVLGKEIEAKINSIRKISAEERRKQIDIKIKIGKEELMAIVDSGADIDYVNEGWCREKGFEIKTIGDGTIKGYNGKEKRTKVKETEVKFRIEGIFQRQKFRVLSETGEDKMVLGMPWLEKHNPTIDWKRREVNLRQLASKEREGNRTPAPQTEDLKFVKRTSTEEAPQGKREEPKGGERGNIPKSSQEKPEGLKTIYEELPEEIKEFADVFSQEK
jgi:hypothetical protein